jgi:hypothetical protein
MQTWQFSRLLLKLLEIRDGLRVCTLADDVLVTAWLTAGKKWLSAVLGQIASRARLRRVGGPCSTYEEENAKVSTEILSGKCQLET